MSTSIVTSQLNQGLFANERLLACVRGLKGEIKVLYLPFSEAKDNNDEGN